MYQHCTYNISVYYSLALLDKCISFCTEETNCQDAWIWPWEISAYGNEYHTAMNTINSRRKGQQMSEMV